MSLQPGDASAASGATPVVVEDLFLTDAFLIKGRLVGKYHRLGKVLEDLERTFLSIEDATLVSLRSREVVRTPRVQVNVSEVLLAHELIDLAGDEAMRSLAIDAKTVRVRAFYRGGIQVELAGRIAPGAYEPSRGPSRRWFVLADPTIRGLDFEGNDDLHVLTNLGYAIVQKTKLSYVYDFG
ncbi:MAG: hypothetical protein IPM29_09025 [Planctomycetes bacterium]|nr:hypothetical protein [Planctomycetota bacterium]